MQFRFQIWNWMANCMKLNHFDHDNVTNLFKEDFEYCPLWLCLVGLAPKTSSKANISGMNAHIVITLLGHSLLKKWSGNTTFQDWRCQVKFTGLPRYIQVTVIASFVIFGVSTWNKNWNGGHAYSFITRLLQKTKFAFGFKDHMGPHLAAIVKTRAPTALGSIRWQNMYWVHSVDEISNKWEISIMLVCIPWLVGMAINK